MGRVRVTAAGPRAMEVSVKLFASLRRYRPGAAIGQAFTCDLPDAATVEVLVADVLGLPPEEVAIVLVNGRQCGREHPLARGDSVALWPPIAGG